MFLAVLHVKDDFEILFITTDGIAAAREVNTLCDRKLKSIPLERIIIILIFFLAMGKSKLSMEANAGSLPHSTAPKRTSKPSSTN